MNLKTIILSITVLIPGSTCFAGSPAAPFDPETLKQTVEVLSQVDKFQERKDAEKGDTKSATDERVKRLIEQCNSSQWSQRAVAVSRLGELGGDANLAIPKVAQLLGDSNAAVRELADKALRKLGAPERGLQAPLVALLDSDDDRIRLKAEKLIEAMGEDGKTIVSAMRIERQRRLDAERRHQLATQDQSYTSTFEVYYYNSEYGTDSRVNTDPISAQGTTPLAALKAACGACSGWSGRDRNYHCRHDRTVGNTTGSSKIGYLSSEQNNVLHQACRSTWTPYRR